MRLLNLSTFHVTQQKAFLLLLDNIFAKNSDGLSFPFFLFYYKTLLPELLFYTENNKRIE